MTDAYHASSALEAEAALLALATELDRTHPGAAASLREGLHETLTVLRLNVSPTLARTLRSTNCIVIWSTCGSVFDVRHGASRSLVLRGGRGYLQSSMRQSLRRVDACSEGHFTGLVA
jgi:hypothetical protein